MYNDSHNVTGGIMTAKEKLGAIQFRKDFSETEKRLNRDYKEIYKVWNDAKRKSLIMENAKFGTDWHKGYASEYSYFMTNLKLKIS